MIINDLNYLKSISNEVQITGAGFKKPSWYGTPKADAVAQATSQAIGFKSYTETLTDTQAVAGLFSSSISYSSASSRGLPVA